MDGRAEVHRWRESGSVGPNGLASRTTIFRNSIQVERRETRISGDGAAHFVPGQRRGSVVTQGEGVRGTLTSEFSQAVMLPLGI
jgi:hypothetical protein